MNSVLLIRAHLYCTVCLLMLPTIGLAEDSDERRRPNIVILYADDLGYGDLSIQNAESKVPTPHLDQLARSGVRFTDAHSSSGICTPSRYALLTGQYHWRKFHDIVNSFEPSVFDAAQTTLPELMQTQGYQTACFGKWHLGWDWKAIMRPDAKPDPQQGYAASAFDWTQSIPDGPLDHGFDEYFGDDVPNFPPYAWIENDRVVEQPTVPRVTPQQPTEGQWEARLGPSVVGWDYWQVMPTVTDRATDWLLDRSKEQPFFLYFAFTSPHAPIVPTTDFKGQSEAGGYGDFLMQTDATVGAVMDALQQANLLEQTIVIFSSDNGPEHYAYERVRKYGHRSMGPLRGLKRDLYEGGHRVPLIVSWPGVVPSGRVSDELISQIDIYATLAELVGAKIPAGEAADSLNQWPLISGQGPTARQTLVHNTFAKGYAIRHHQWLLIQAKSGAVTKVPDWYQKANGYTRNTLDGELYDLSQDLGQQSNLYQQQPQRVREMSQLLESIRTPTSSR